MGKGISVYLTRHACLKLNEYTGLSKSYADIVQNLNQGVDNGFLSEHPAHLGVHRLYVPQMGFTFVLVERPIGYVAKTAMSVYDDNKDTPNPRKEKEVNVSWFGPEELDKLEKDSGMQAENTT
jgi:hypothetical protein